MKVKKALTMTKQGHTEQVKSFNRADIMTITVSINSVMEDFREIVGFSMAKIRFARKTAIEQRKWLSFL